MANKKKNKKSLPKVDQVKDVFKPNKTPFLAGLMILAFALYVNTLFHDFALDDAIVISENAFTKKGIVGISDIFSKDTFHGFFGEAGKDRLVSGGRYRPFTLAMFAIERTIFGETPIFHHLINILLYALTGVVVFLCSFKLFEKKYSGKKILFLALATAVLFIAHPLHTEAVANIKGRDEILAFLGSLSALYILARKSFSSLDWKNILLASIFFFVALLSKENAITFLLVIPLVAIIFYGKKLRDAIRISLPFLGTAILFMIIRTSVIGFDFGAAPSGEFMNNPYLKIVNGAYVPFSASEKLATIFFTLFKYIQLLIFPHPLTHDYYPNHVSLKTFANPAALIGLVSYIALIGLSIWGILKKKTWAFFTSYYLITISIVSNIVFPIGTHMSERFLFMPSFGFVSLLSMLIFSIKGKNGIKIGLVFLSILGVAYSIKTIDRNKVWKDNYTLFTTDALTSVNSAKVNNAAAGTIGEKIQTLEEGSEKNDLINRSIGHADKAISAHPNYINAYLLKGNALFYGNRFEEAIAQYETCLRIDPNYQDALKNIFLTYRGAGRYYGEKKNDLASSLNYLNKALALEDKDFETNRLLGTCYGIMGNHNLAVKHFIKCTEVEPNNPGIYVSIARAYELLGNQPASQEALAKAKAIDPNILNK